MRQCPECGYEPVIDCDLWADWDDKRFQEVVRLLTGPDSRPLSLEGFLFHALDQARKPRFNNRIYIALSTLLVLGVADWFPWGFVPAWWLIFLSFFPFYFIARECTVLNEATIRRCATGAFRAWVESGRALSGLVHESSTTPDQPIAHSYTHWIMVDDPITQRFLTHLPGIPLENWRIMNIDQLEPEHMEALQTNPDAPLFLLHSDAITGSDMLGKMNSRFPMKSRADSWVDLGCTRDQTATVRQKVSWGPHPMSIHALPIKDLADRLVAAVGARIPLNLA